jgi:NDP-sugar pyrophosphorylase family protein
MRSTLERCSTRHAIILVAGESKRTRPLTLHRPKPLIPLLGRPLLAHILDELVDLVDRVTLVVGYRADDIRAHFGTNYQGIEMRYVNQREVNGTASAVLSVAGAVDEPFFLLYGDNLISRADVAGVCRRRYSMAALAVDDPRSFGILDISGTQVLKIIEKPQNPPPGALANPGIYHFDAEVFPLLYRIEPSPRGEYELTDLIALLAQEEPVGYHVCTGYWVPVGTPWEALGANMFLLARRAPRPARLDTAAQIASDAQVIGAAHIGRASIGPGSRIIGPAYIGDGCVIGAGALIEGSSLEANVQIGARSIVQRSALGAGVQVGQNCLIQSSLLDEDALVGSGARLPEHHFADVRPVAATGGLLSREALATRGAIVARAAVIAPGSVIEPGSIL